MTARGLVADLHGVDAGVLTVGGVSVTDLVREHGTPLYAYDAGILRRRYALLRESLPPRVDIFYSVKANPNPAIVRVFVDCGAGCEVASAAEYVRARAAGCRPERIVFAGPAKGHDELRFVLSRGVGEIHVESDEEIADLRAIASTLGHVIQVSIRINPASAPAGGGMLMGGQPAPFGIDEERLEDVVGAILKSPGLRLDGVHIYAGTQVLDAGALVRQWRTACELGRRVAAISGRPIRTIDLGGGLGIPYFSNEQWLDVATLQTEASSLFAEIHDDSVLRHARFIVEPGRFLVGPAGVYLVRVRSVKMSRGARFLITDGGMHHHLAASGNLGQVLKRDYPVINALHINDAGNSIAAVTGSLCTPLDVLGRRVPITAVVNDIVAVLQSGAYGLTASPVGFLSHPMPAEVLVDDGAVHRIRERGSFEAPLVQLPMSPAIS